ncbi:MAG: hypothetical protein Q9M97_01335 [Candidatus Gracilibacteria bacterium]|nr:hypothetical protein [Candidatus Gracilibacteria bacterium]
MNIGISILAALLGAAFVSVFFFIWENRKLANANDKSVNMLEKATSKKDKILMKLEKRQIQF